MRTYELKYKKLSDAMQFVADENNTNCGGVATMLDLNVFNGDGTITMTDGTTSTYVMSTDQGQTLIYTDSNGQQTIYYGG